MRCFHHPDTVLHQPPQFLVRGQPKPVPEKPERVQAVLDALNRRGDRVEQAPDAGPAARAAATAQFDAALVAAQVPSAMGHAVSLM